MHRTEECNFWTQRDTDLTSTSLQAGHEGWGLVILHIYKIFSALVDHPEPFFGILLVLLTGFIQAPALPGICLVIFTWSPFLELWQAISVSLTLTFGCAFTPDLWFLSTVGRAQSASINPALWQEGKCSNSYPDQALDAAC